MSITITSKTNNIENKLNTNNQALDNQVNHILNTLSLDEKIHLLGPKSLWQSKGIPQKNIKPLRFTDGPRGVAYHSSFKRASAFPCGIALAASWDIELAEKMGQAMAEEALSINANVLLAPAVNICRTPLNGRTFEYFSEDPFLNKCFTVPVIKGIQSKGVAACVKHYVANNQETHRRKNSSQVSERALHEIYLPAFEAAVKEADVWSVMAAYNGINGIAACEHKSLLTHKLREEYGFKGLVVSDWYAAQRTTSTAHCIKAGLNIEMPKKASRYSFKHIKQAYNNGEINEQDIDKRAAEILKVMILTGNMHNDRESGEINSPRHRQLARKIASSSITLLKNTHNILPLSNKTKKIAIIGPMANKKLCKPLHGGSAGVWTNNEITPLEGIKKKIFSKGEYSHIEVVEKDEDADAVIICVGLGHGLGKDSEFKDRKTLRLPENQEKLIRYTRLRNPNTIVVLISGSPLEMEWLGLTQAVIMAWYPGMTSGDAIADIIFGDVNPSGKLPVTFPKALQDSPAHQSPNMYPGDKQKVFYDEGIFVGYRHFDKHNIEPLFPFGYGLSYSTFEYKKIKASPKKITTEETCIISCDVMNTSEKDGHEIVQLYISSDKSKIIRAEQELKGFKKVFIKAGEKQHIEFLLSIDDFSYYCEQEKSWLVEKGKYTVSLGSSSRDIRLTTKVSI